MTLKRTPLKRKTPLESRFELARTPLRRRTGLKPRSAKTRRVYEVRAELVEALLANVPWCQIQWDDGCDGRATDVHEPGMRSRNQVDITDETECVTCCRHCHDQVHAHPAEAEARGWMRPSGPVRKAAS